MIASTRNDEHSRCYRSQLRPATSVDGGLFASRHDQKMILVVRPHVARKRQRSEADIDRSGLWPKVLRRQFVPLSVGGIQSFRFGRGGPVEFSATHVRVNVATDF